MCILFIVSQAFKKFKSRGVKYDHHFFSYFQLVLASVSLPLKMATYVSVEIRIQYLQSQCQCGVSRSVVRGWQNFICQIFLDVCYVQLNGFLEQITKKFPTLSSGYWALFVQQFIRFFAAYMQLLLNHRYNLVNFIIQLHCLYSGKIF